MIPLEALPTLNACLNGSSAVLLATGYAFIRKKRIAAHRACMLSAVGTSVLFLISYIIYHLQVGTTRFIGPPAVRMVYLVILFTHTTLAVAIVPLVATTLIRALRGRFELHRRIARWTLPIWFYVSVTGVVIYFMLYHLYPVREEPDEGLAAWCSSPCNASSGAELVLTHDGGELTFLNKAPAGPLAPAPKASIDRP